MQRSFLSEANQFFRDTDEEIDPDAALFIKFYSDPAFWLWFGEEIKSQTDLIGHDLTARPLLDRYLHGIVCADKHLGANGSVIQAMGEVLSHTPEILSGWLNAPDLSLKKSLDEEAGPHSTYASARFITHAWSTLGDRAPGILNALTGHLRDDLQPLMISASLGQPASSEAIRGGSEGDLRAGLVLRLLTAVQSASLPGAGSASADVVFSSNVHENLRSEGYLSWPEWQLLPLLVGGIDHAERYGIDLIEVSKLDPISGKDSSIWTAAFMVSHAASSDTLHDYFCNVLLPTGDPAEIMKKIWSMGTAMGKWAPGYIEQHREVFLATPAPSASSLESLIRHGVPKQTVMSHPGFSRKAKGRILSDDLGM